ncbi:MAG: HpcH/HpaI aldolase/citrate lyase family protein [Roseateles sp.]|uniref:HpcH/HpaI aldolase/citrate lyase family protein n=1 Tax=Roseateles sp. TaxID=1971397 RepID=UPI004036250A
MTALIHPREALFGSEAPRAALPVVDHYCGVEARMRKSLALQSELGPVFDITLDAEDGAPVGGEAEHALLIADLATSTANRFGRVGARVHPFGHGAFDADVDTLIAKAGASLAYLMIPKPDSAEEVDRAVTAIDAACEHHARPKLPLQVLIETHGALRDVFRIAAHPRIESLSFGLMDFVSAHGGAIPKAAMELPGQFEHPLVVRAKLEIAAAAHAFGKTPSHCVVTEFRDAAALAGAARRGAREFGYLRMWSIHPDQIRPIVDAFAPAPDEIAEATELLLAAQSRHWAPISFRDRLHDRASYRYFWTVLERAQRTGCTLPAEARSAFFPVSIG